MSMPRPDTCHWRQCNDDDCIVCASRRLEFEEEARRRLQDVDIEKRIEAIAERSQP